MDINANITQSCPTCCNIRNLKTVENGLKGDPEITISEVSQNHIFNNYVGAERASGIPALLNLDSAPNLKPTSIKNETNGTDIPTHARPDLSLTFTSVSSAGVSQPGKHKKCDANEKKSL